MSSSSPGLPGKEWELPEKVEKERQIPEEVYINYPLRYLPLVLTFKHKHGIFSDYPVENKSVQLLASTEEQAPGQNVFSIVMKNNGRYGEYPKLNNKAFLEEMKYFIPEVFYEHFMRFDEHFFTQATRETWIEFLERIVQKDTQRLAELRFHISHVQEKEGKLYVRDKNASMEIEGIIYKGKYVKFEDIKLLEEEIYEDIKIFEFISAVQPGDYLFRAVGQAEWQNILQYGYYIMNDNTNFEDEIGPQVIAYSQSPDYAGKIIRVKVQKGQYFRKAGMNPPRLVNLSPLFADVEILAKDDEWLSVEEYKAQAGE